MVGGRIIRAEFRMRLATTYKTFTKIPVSWLFGIRHTYICTRWPPPLFPSCRYRDPSCGSGGDINILQVVSVSQPASQQRWRRQRPRIFHFFSLGRHLLFAFCSSSLPAYAVCGLWKRVTQVAGGVLLANLAMRSSIH